ncbi:T9SS type A sorting domain-containing protein [Ichthyobacterium seriolicida]|uniref:Secretion system C-terminal sorting domain-containing protein n=1 Tax=Ichthyobacterium seriolicida TaxID=242600 RepID=A0A1J1E5H0_9FLAO|nr:T9SS type A sorting domain-containing protein [Ichthyobacterium seriolicida]BAV94558.1 hypothetical protein JBKA6_0545 [Ichthyobacterium seriolicida]
MFLQKVNVIPNRFLISCLVVLLSCSLSSRAQQSFNSSGGTASNSAGSFSYSLGQLFFNTLEGEDGTTVHEGIQHSFELFEILGDDPISDDELIKPTFPEGNFKVYPNPVVDLLTIEIDGINSEGDMETLLSQRIKYKIYSYDGKLLLNKDITSNLTQVDLQDFPTAGYIMHITDGNTLSASFKIIKN